jgi:hypothetical protein
VLAAVLLCAACDDGRPELHCGAGFDYPALEPPTHVTEGDPTTYKANPPASGMHYFPTRPWNVYPTPVPRGYWVHNMEHGGIILLYNCPTDCPDDVAKLVAIVNSRMPDQFGEVRLLVTPDPLMPRRFAALAWGYRWQGDAVDTAAIQCLINARYDRAPESFP